jgi:hypothetical protein
VERLDYKLHLDTWIRFYSHLSERHAITGLTRFSVGYFRRLADLSGLTAFGAFEQEGELAAMQLWIEHGRTAYYHLGASSDAGSV